MDESKFDLKKFIGPPIQWSFYQIFGDDMRLFKALDYFRGVYLDFMTDNTLYDGVKELLEKLAADGLRWASPPPNTSLTPSRCSKSWAF